MTAETSGASPLSAEEKRIVSVMENTCRAGDEYGALMAIWRFDR